MTSPMEILKPNIVVINGLRYRINPGQYSHGGFNHERLEEQYYDQYDDTPACEAFSDGEDDIEEIEGGRYKASFHIAKSYFPYIIGSKGATKKRLETESRSKIIIPKQGQDGDIVVTAATKKNVASARRRIKLMVLSSRKRRPPTHFLSIPLNKPSFIDGFMRFKSEILLKYGNDNGISENIFQSPERLHLTIAVLALSDEQERLEAAAALHECKETVISPLLQSNKLRIEMQGIDIMNDDPSSVRILFGRVKAYNDEDLLQDLVDGINSFFSEKGLLIRETSRVKLHCTLMNVAFTERDEDSAESIEPTKNFDATNIMKNYVDFYFGEDIVHSVELSLFHTSSRNEYYKSSSTVTVP